MPNKIKTNFQRCKMWNVRNRAVDTYCGINLFVYRRRCTKRVFGIQGDDHTLLLLLRRLTKLRRSKLKTSTCRKPANKGWERHFNTLALRNGLLVKGEECHGCPPVSTWGFAIAQCPLSELPDTVSEVCVMAKGQRAFSWRIRILMVSCDINSTYWLVAI